MTVPRSAACARGWFPPATFQLRLRSLRSIIFIASAKPRSGVNSGYFYLTLHERPTSEPFWTSSAKKWSTEREETRLVWSDLDLDNTGVHLALKSVVVAVWFKQNIEGDSEHVKHNASDSLMDTMWGIYFSGLWCLGTHPPPHGRLPHDALVLYMCGSYFSSAVHIRDKERDTFIPRYLHIGKAEECQAVGSYDTTLLDRLQFIQRALKKQEECNNCFKSDLRHMGVLNLSEAEQHPKQIKDTNRRTVNVFSRQVKSLATRIRETELQARIERARVRVDLLSVEKSQLEKENGVMVARRQKLAAEIEEKSSFLMRCFHGLAKEKAHFRDWMSEFEQDCKAHSAWSSALRRQRLALIHAMSFIFPVGNLNGNQPTLRYVALPAASELRDMSKNEVVISVVIGWLADLLTVISRILDAPLRYPLHLQGSTSTITDHLKYVPPPSDSDSRDFPLFVGRGNSDWSRFEYGIYLLNKNLSQLRWQCSLATADLRPILRNVAELMSLGEKMASLTDGDVEALPRVKTLTSPPKSVEHQIVIKSGRAQIQGANRGGSPLKSVASTPVGNRSRSVNDISINDCDDSHSSSSSSSETESSNEGNQSKLSAEASPKSSPIHVMSSTSLTSPIRVMSSSSLTSPTRVKSSTSLTSPTSPNGTTSLGKEQYVFWGEVTSRTIALSAPSSFQRPRTNNN